MTLLERFNSITTMLFDACKTGRLESLAIISIATFAGCLFALALVREKTRLNLAQFDRAEYERKAKLNRIELYAGSLAAIYFVACFLSFAAEGWGDHELLILHIIRSALTALLVFSLAAATIVIVKAVNEVLPVFSWCFKIASCALGAIKTLFERDEPATELIADPIIEIPEPMSLVQDELRTAQLELQSRRALVEESGLDVYEVEAIENQLKQAHLKRVRDILNQDEHPRRR